MNIAAPRPNSFGQPQQALTRWHFLGALALLALNDHVLKHAGVLPPWLTGKLSDFAGLYIAPVLLCTLLRQESLRALAYCSLLTFAVFTTLELSPFAARAVEHWTQALGFPWLLTCDVTDLLALPMLWLGYHVFSAPAPRRWTRDNAVRVRPSLRWHERGIAALATLACAATSAPVEEIGIQTNGPVIVNGSKKSDVELLIQVPREDISIDCAAIAESPGERLPRSAFGPITRFSLRPLETLILDQWTFRRTSGCSLLLVEIPGRTPTLFFWQDHTPEPHEVPRRLTPKQLERAADAPQYITVLFNDGEADRFKDNADRVFAFEPRTHVEDACEPNLSSLELWTPFASSGAPLLLASKRYAADGCFELTFNAVTPAPADVELPEPQPPESDAGIAPSPDDTATADAGAAPSTDSTATADAGTAPVPDDTATADAGDVPSLDAGVTLSPNDGGVPDAASVRWLQQNTTVNGSRLWVCLPEEALPFEVGDELTVEQNQYLMVIERPEDGAALRVLNEGIGNVGSVVAEWTQIAESDCPYRVFEEPTLTVRRTSVRVSTPWGAVTLNPGEQQWLRSESHDVLVGVLEARQHVVGSEPLLPHTSGFVLALPAAHETTPATQDEKAGQP